MTQLFKGYRTYISIAIYELKNMTNTFQPHIFNQIQTNKYSQLPAYNKMGVHWINREYCDHILHLQTHKMAISIRQHTFWVQM